MTEFLRCPKGHQWTISDSNAPIHRGADDPTRLVCPVCGSLPDNDTFSEPTALTAPPDQLTSKLNENEQGSTDSNTPLQNISPTQTWTNPFTGDEDDETTLPAAPTVLTTEEQVARLLPDYELLALLGRGGMGMVYKARHKPLNRFVALKMLHAHAAPPKTLARFQAEAQAIAQLRHPNIVQIYEIGEFDGKPFLSLECVEGGSLSRQLRKKAYTPRQAAQLIETIARAVHYAHQQGILHRDLKPGNILLTDDGTPKITDFGLAKKIEAIQKGTGINRLTETGEILGTPSYMAPEQAAALSQAIGPATDVYALGAILYELLTRQPPFEGDTPMQTILQVLEREPIPPIKIEAAIPRDLQTICLTCLHKEPSRRYQSAEALADDLRAFLVGEAIKARPPSRREKALRWLRRHPVIALGIGVGAAAVVALIVGVLLRFDPIAAVGVAVASLLVAAWWYSTRLQRTLRHLKDEHLQAERNVERMNLLLETTRELMKADGLEKILYILSETTTRMVNAERATIYLIDEDRQELWSKIALGDDVGEIRIKVGEGIAGAVAQTGEIINIANPYADERFNPEIDRRTGYKTRNLLTLPMKASDRHIVGVFQVLNKRTGAFTAEDVRVLQALASSAAIAVERATGSPAAQL